MRVKELLKHFPKDFMVDICTPICRIGNTVENILKDDFTEVWKNGFGAYRRNLYEENENCKACKEREFCGGGSFHSWDFDKNRQKMCFKGTLF